MRAAAVTTWIDSIAGDVRHAAGALRHARAFSLWVICTLGIGMAVATAGLAFLHASLALPFAGVTEQERLVRVSVSRQCAGPDCWRPMSAEADYLGLRHMLTGLEGLVAYTHGDVVAALPYARSTRAVFASANYFDVLGVRPALGRAFTAVDANANAAVAVIAHTLWVREFAADPTVIGRSVRVDGRFVQIVGIAPPLFFGIDRVRPGDRASELWLPLWLADDMLPLTAAERRRGQRDTYFAGRLRDGVDVPHLQAEASVVAARLAAQTAGEGSSRGVAQVRRVWRVNPENWHFGAAVVMPIPLLVLVIACVNAANLMLARGSQRQREIAIRLALGATRWRVVRQLLFESAMLAAIATSIAVPVAWWALQLASRPWDGAIPVNTVVVALTALIGAGTPIVFGLAPALRVSARHPSSAIGGAGGRSDAKPQQSRARRALVAAQVALSLALFASGWQLVSTVRAQAVSGGTAPDRLLVARFDLQRAHQPQQSADTFYSNLVARASTLPGVVAAGVARHTAVWTFGQGSAPGSIMVWRPADAADQGRVVIGGYAGGDLFGAVGLRITSGRDFMEADRRGRPQVAIVNQTFAAAHGVAVGSMLRVAARAPSSSAALDVRIVGIIEPAAEPKYTRGDPPAAKVYLPSALEPELALSLYVRTSDPAVAVAQPLRDLVSQIAPEVPVLELGSLEEFNERSYAPQLWLARAAAVLGAIGLLLAAAGLYGISSYVVRLRAREIAVRMTVGAAPRVILRMVLGQSMLLAAFGLVVGAIAAFGVSRFIQAEYHGIQGIDASAFGGAVGLFIAAMLLAGAVPAVRAAHIDPVENLKD